MKKTLLIAAISFAVNGVYSQTQIGNGDMELWESVASDSEPENWNSFLTAGGFFSGFASNQIEQSTDVRTGSTGVSSAKIWSNEVLGTIANGNMTLGKINMGATNPTSSSNYNESVTGDAAFSEAFTDAPDSLVFWAKFNPVNGSDIARVRAAIHSDYDYRDPEDAASSDELVGEALLNYPSTNNQWVRFSVPFSYDGPASTSAYILVTFTTNEIAGGGSDGDEVYIDDVELIYNPADTDSDGDGVLASTESVDGTSDSDPCDFVLANATETPSSAWDAADCDNDGVSNGQEVIDGTDPLVHNSASLSDLMADGIKVSYLNGSINIISENSLKGGYVICNALGQVVDNGEIASSIDFSADKGLYFVKLISSSQIYSFEILVD